MITNHDFDISFCIPTYNFGRFIGETLDSIIQQADERIQIVIVDGGSTDNTAQIVAEKTKVFANIKFIERRERSGVDRDILESVVQADGEFCWLFSSDDLLNPGAVAFVREQMQSSWDVFLTNYSVCDLQMKRRFRQPILDVPAITTFDWSSPGDRARYFGRAETTAAFFSFISALIVRRSSWMRVPHQAEFVGSCWIIAAQLFAVAREGLVVRYCPGELLRARSGNDSFASRGPIDRIALTITGFRRVTEHYFGKGSPEARQVSRAIKNEHPLLDMLIHKFQTADLNDNTEMLKFTALVEQQFSDGLILDWVRRNIILVAAGRILRVVVWISCRMAVLVRQPRYSIGRIRKHSRAFLDRLRGGIVLDRPPA
jgi:abequosyltransferase